VHGREYWINAWATTPKSGGDKFLSGSVTLKEDKPAPRPVQQKVAELDDAVPF
jgi:hypothetical protein